MDLIGTVKTLKKLIPSLKEVSTDISQAGEYLFFNGLKQQSYKQDIASFQIIIAGNSLTGKGLAVLERLQTIRKILDDNKVSFTGKDIFTGIEPIENASGTLFTYSINLEIEVFNEI